MDNELLCITCRARFLAIHQQQWCCNKDCAVRAGRNGEIRLVYEALDDMHRKAWAIQLGKTYE